MKELEMLLKTVSDGLKILAQGVNVIADKLENFTESKKTDTTRPQAEPAPVHETHTETSGRGTSPRAAKQPGPRGKKGASASEIVYEAMNRAKGPVNIDLLAKKTGFEKNKLHNVLYRLKKQGRIESVSKGVYRKV